MAFSFSTSASEAEAAVNAHMNAGKTGAAASETPAGKTSISAAAAPGKAAPERGARGPSLPSGGDDGGSRGKIGWNPSRLSLADTIPETGSGGGGTAIPTGGSGPKIGWNPSRIGATGDTAAIGSTSAGCVGAATPGKGKTKLGWDPSRLGAGGSGGDDTGRRENECDAGIGSSSGSKTKVGWNPSRLEATATAGRPAVPGGGGGDTALPSRKQAQPESGAAVGAGGGSYKTAPVATALLTSSDPAEGSEQQRQQQPLHKVGWDPTRTAVATSAAAAPPSSSPSSGNRQAPAAASAAPGSTLSVSTAPSRHGAHDATPDIVRDTTGALPPPLPASPALFALSSAAERGAATDNIGWTAPRAATPSVPTPAVKSNPSVTTEERGSEKLVGASHRVGWNPLGVGSTAAPVPAAIEASGLPTAEGGAGAGTGTGSGAVTEAKPKIGWNASRIGNPAVPAPVSSGSGTAAPVSTRAADVAAAVTAAVDVARRTVAGRGSGGAGAAAAGVDDDTGARRRGVPLQLRAVLLYASTQRGIDLRKWFDLGGGEDRGGDENEEEQEGAAATRGEDARTSVDGDTARCHFRCLCSHFDQVMFFLDHVSECCCWRLSPPLHLLTRNSSSQRAPCPVDDGPVRGCAGGTGRRPQGKGSFGGLYSLIAEIASLERIAVQSLDDILPLSPTR